MEIEFYKVSWFLSFFKAALLRHAARARRPMVASGLDAIGTMKSATTAAAQKRRSISPTAVKTEGPFFLARGTLMTTTTMTTTKKKKKMGKGQ